MVLVRLTWKVAQPSRAGQIVVLILGVTVGAIFAPASYSGGGEEAYS